MVDKGDRGGKMDDEQFLERVASSLRTSEHAHSSFEKRLMEKVRAEGPSVYPAFVPTHQSWWRTARAYKVTPLSAIAIAASALIAVALSGVAIGARLAGDRTARPAAIAQAPQDTVQFVRFVYVDAKAASVQLVGDFNEWTKGSTELKPSGVPGVWSVSVPLSPGRHEYAFIVDGARWVADPLAVKSSDDFGTESSMIRVGSNGKTTT